MIDELVKTKHFRQKEQKECSNKWPLHTCTRNV